MNDILRGILEMDFKHALEGFAERMFLPLRDVVQEVQQIFGRILPKKFAKTIKKEWVQCVTEWIVVDGRYFKKDHQKGVASKAKNECPVSIPNKCNVVKFCLSFFQQGCAKLPLFECLYLRL